MKPYIKKIICDTETPISLFLKMVKGRPYAFLFESAEVSHVNGRYSFLGFDPLDLHVFPAGGDENPLVILRKAYENIDYEPSEDLPSFQAGFVGYFAYEVVRHFESLNLPLQRKFADEVLPEGVFFLPKKLLIFDHLQKILILVAYEKSVLDELVNEYECATMDSSQSFFISCDFGDKHRTHSDQKLGDRDLHFENLVKNAQEKIKAGDIFQIVLSQVFEQETDLAPFDLYRKLRLQSPSPYMYYLQYPDFSIIGCSPETLVKMENDQIIVRPIAGTRPRGKNFEEDRALAEELRHDVKECAEHMMLVDLGRNDVGKVAESGTVEVTQLMHVEKFSHVMHLVSEVRGMRRKTVNGLSKVTLFDVFRAAFPAGTLTGAPKVRAMQFIAQLEAEPRGIYGGAVGYFDLSGNMDFAITIRTMLYRNGKVQVRAGAGIVYDSLPAAEDQECKNKARGPLAILSL